MVLPGLGLCLAASDYAQRHMFMHLASFRLSIRLGISFKVQVKTSWLAASSSQRSGHLVARGRAEMRGRMRVEEVKAKVTVMVSVPVSEKSKFTCKNTHKRKRKGKC